MTPSERSGATRSEGMSQRIRTASGRVANDEPAYMGAPRVPGQRELVFIAHERRRDIADDVEPRFADDRWPLGQIEHSSNQNSLTIDFTTFPAWSRATAKTYIWNLLNTHPVQVSIKSRRPLLSPVSTHAAARHLRYFAEWLDNEGVTHMSTVSAEMFDAYATDVASHRTAWSTKALYLLYLSRFHMHNDGLPRDLSFPRPPWFDEDLKHWLGLPDLWHENRTEPIEPDVMGPLLRAALIVVDTYLRGTLTVGGNKGVHLAARTWALENGIETQSNRTAGAAATAAFKTASNWAPNLDRADVRAACIIVVSYLTGMRPKEVLHLRQDCLQVEEREDANAPAGVKRYRILGHVFKNVTDETGRAVTAGTQRRQPWVTIEPVARAVEAARRLAGDHPSGLLFAPFHTPEGPRERTGEALPTTSANKDIRDFADHWNLIAAADPKAEPIPVVTVSTTEVLASGGPAIEQERGRQSLSLGRLRRTLAWHIARQPGGEIALGIQYGHLRIATSLGYAGRTESGFPDEVEFDHLMAAWDGLDLLSREIEIGSHVSGPAAARLLEGVGRYQSDFAGQIKTEAQLKRLRETGLHVIHDNPLASNVCVFRSATAACLSDTVDDSNRRTPDLANCRSDCPNIALMDSHIDARRAERGRLAEEMAYLPKPLAHRAQHRLDRLDASISRHVSGVIGGRCE